MRCVKFIFLAIVLISKTTLAQKGQILHEGCICFDSASVDQSLKWYALIPSEQKFYFILKPVKITLNTRHNCEISSLEIRTDSNLKSRFLIGTNQNWKERQIYAPYNWENWAGVDVTKTDMDIYSINLTDSNKSTSNRLYKFGRDVFDGLAITGNNRSGQKTVQELNNNFELQTVRAVGLHLRWFGDLDGDDIADMIFSVATDGEGGTFYYLFLSSEASSNEVIRKTGTTHIGRCN